MHPKFSRKIFATAGVVLLGLVALIGGGDRVSASATRTPDLYLWAWERPEDLRFLEGSDTGVAYLAATLTLTGDRVEFQPRRQPLRVHPATPLTTVFRLEASRTDLPDYSDEQVRHLVGLVMAVTRDAGTSSIQIDFDAVQSERFFYQKLLWDLRDALPRNVSISMTALASWCIGDRWMAGLPVTEAVPMLFDMGTDRDSILHRLDSGDDFRDSLCRSSVGIATYDFPRRMPRGRRLYLFHDGPWTQGALEDLLLEVRR